MSGSRFQARSGSLLHVEERGTGLPLLALHGLGGGAWFFSGFAARLSGRCRVIAIDLPGTGRSTTGPVPPAVRPGLECPGSRASNGEPRVQMDAWTRDILDLVEHHIGEPAIVLGHSMGTILALQVAAAAPQWTRAMIFVGGLPEPRPEIRARLTARADAVRRGGLAGLGATAAAANFAGRTQEAQPELVAMYERLFELQDAGTYAAWCDLLVGASAAHLVPAVSVPCASIVGIEDQYAPAGLVSAFARSVPGGCREEVMAGCGHLPFLEAPDRFAGLVASFLATLC